MGNKNRQNLYQLIRVNVCINGGLCVKRLYFLGLVTNGWMKLDSGILKVPPKIEVSETATLPSIISETTKNNTRLESTPKPVVIPSEPR